MAQIKQEVAERSRKAGSSRKSGRPLTFKNVLRFFISSWRRRVLEIVFVIALLAIFHESFYKLYTSTRDGIISSLALGLIPIIAYIFVIGWVTARRRPLLRKRWNRWVGIAMLIGSAMGVMAYFRGSQGILREATYGGNWGFDVRGGNAYFGGVRIAALTLAGSWIAFPKGTPWVLANTAYGIVTVVNQVSVVIRKIAGTMKHLAVTSYAFAFMAADHGIRAVGLAKKRIERGIPSAHEYGAPVLTEGSDNDNKVDEGEGEAGAFSAPEYEGIQPAQTSKAIQARFPWLRKEAKEENDRAQASDMPMQVPASPIQAQTSKVPVRAWKLPSVKMLWEAPETNISEEIQKSTADTIEQTLGDYGIEVKVKKIKPGPTVTMYGLEPGWIRKYKQVKEKDKSGQFKLDERGKPITAEVENKTRVKVDSIVAREKDLALALAAPNIRIEAPVPNESVVGIEVPNPNPSIVTIRSVMESDAYRKLRPKAQMPIALGKGSGGEVVVTDLVKMPHLLIAGATGSGKSVCINSVITSLLMERSPAEVRLLLIDPKRVELNLYNGIPHLLKPTIVETPEAVQLLKGVIQEMLKRYKVFEEASVRNIQAYNKKVPEIMPYLVVVIDELADLMMTSQYEAESSLCRLAQLGRATGIHLVVATQRPSVNVVTGLIKANFPSRISFAVASQVDSRTILDSAGADKLLGRGDMLYLPIDGLKPKRCQGVFISDQEIESLVNFWKVSKGPPLPTIDLDVVEGEDTSGGEESNSPKDELLDKARELTNSYTKISTSLLQRRLRIGYPRAARLMEKLEEEGLVDASEAGKPKDVTTNWS